MSGSVIDVTLPDGSSRSLPTSSTALDLAQSIGSRLAKAAVAALIKEAGATSVKDMGKVMAALKAKYAGQMDMAKAGAIVKSLLGG